MALVILAACSPAALSAAPQQVEGLVNLRFQIDVRVFAVMSALNAAGFDLDADSLDKNPTRRIVRDRLSAAPGELRQRLRDFYRPIAEGLSPDTTQSKFVSYALLLKGPPGFQLPFKSEEVPEDARPVIGFESLVAELWRTADLSELWSTVATRYTAEAQAYRPLLRDIIVATLRYMRTEPRIALDREVAFVPDLLNGYGIVNARNIGNTYIVVVGPSRNQSRPLRSLRHEYLHFLLDPLIAKHRGALPESAPFMARVREQASSLPRYRDDFMLMLTESLIRTVELRLDAGASVDTRSELLRLYDEGLILSPYFSDALQRFEKRSDALQEFFAELMGGIDWGTEKKRAAEIDGWRKELSTTSAEAPRPTPVQHGNTQVSSLLAEANRLLVARQFEAAASVLEKVVALDPQNTSALFGLGQVSAQRQEYERALDFYSRAAANATPAEAWIAAWSYVRRGNIFRFQDEPDKARAEWKRVLGLSGDLRGALEAARKALEEK